MNGIIKALSTLAGVAAAGFLLWVAAQVGRHSTGGYWAAYAIVAAAGLVLALSQGRGRTGHPRAMLTFGFLPVLVVAGWVLIAMEPHGNWFRDHALAWSRDMGIGDAVRDVGTWTGVLALGIGFTLGAMLERTPRPRVVETHEPAIEDEPVAAEPSEEATTVTGAPATTEEPAPIP
jgi:hypothetical protein